MTQLEVAPRLPCTLKFNDDAFLQANTVVVPRRKVSLTAPVARAVAPKPPACATIECSALVIGCGVAGNATALRLANRGVKVTMISAAEDPHDCATYYAQGGIIYKSEDDSPALLASDVHRAGAGVCDDAAVQKLAAEGPARVEELLLDVANVPFARAADGTLQLTLEASHNRARILYKADHTGRAIATSMVAAVRAHANIELVTGRSAIELVTNARGKCVGALTVAAADGALAHYRAPFTLLATGGVGDVYANTSNPAGARGEGLALAARAGAALRNLQYVQFHPTTLCVPHERRFLLTEALRGEGAILRDGAGRAFAKDYHPDGELAPRDVVARTILAEMDKQGGAPCMFLDISHADAAWTRARFPTIYAHCLARGIDLTTQPVPVVPAAHYHCGGVAVDLHGATSVPGLYAAGEVSCTGVHGANRLASTSLLEGLVWGCSAADHFLATQGQEEASAGSTSDDTTCASALTAPSASTTTNDDDAAVAELLAGLCGTREPSANELAELLRATQRVMWDGVGPKRTARGMASAVDKLARLERRAEALYRECVVTRQSAGVRNAVRAAKEIARAALHAPQSVGTHYVVPEQSATSA
ncbi:hypothetical protein PybrP1_003216 [[Pythium] brassicae (nom. inval.)]|nr:hypothetical protein PybrP1_003216 [[Pythium] brassicae (nom. inval.)]